MIRLYIFLMSTLLVGTSYAEEFLITPQTKWLGSKTEANRFITCEGTVLEIGKNKLQPTNPKCKGYGDPKPARPNVDVQRLR
jgi:hypothetical protein